MWAKRSVLSAKVWTLDELSEMGRNLRTFIEQKARERESVLARLAWPEDVFYDLRAFQHSGIDDPVALGLCDNPIQEEQQPETLRPSDRHTGPERGKHA